jgi:predicted O-linked N-acetylglucosamine transferase (SPINDLY family)
MMPSLGNQLSSVKADFTSEVELINGFVVLVADSLSLDKPPPLFAALKEKEREDLRKFVEFFRLDIEGKRPAKLPTIHSKAVVQLVSTRINLIRQQCLLAEMALTHLITFQEAFLKDYMKVILQSREEMLRSRRQLTCEEVLTHSSRRSLLAFLAQSEVDDLGRGSIDDFAEAYERRLNVSFDNFPQWERLREASYRRNLIVHNSSVTNEIYCSKTGFTKRREKLSTDLEYVRDLAPTLLLFFKFVHNNVAKKFAKPRQA